MDYLKYDYCYKPRTMDGEILYRRMSLALKNSGRDILFSACNWGSDQSHNWMRSAGAHMYRSTGDIQDNWESIKKLAVSQLDKASFTGNFCHNDMDMLVVGMRGGSNNDFIGKIGGCTDEEYKTHFSLWCMMGSPLMMGCDIRNADEMTKRILQNPDFIKINQDPEARGFYGIYPDHQWLTTTGCFILVKVLADGELAIGFFNLGEGKREIPLQFWDLGLSYASGMELSLYDCWEQKELGRYKERFAAVVPSHDCLIVRGKLI